MLPNIRLMIAATFVCFVALGCGFTMFAAFRVNHAPLARLSSAATPLQLSASAALPARSVATETLPDRPFQIAERGDSGTNSALAYAPTNLTEQPAIKGALAVADDSDHDMSALEPAMAADAATELKGDAPKPPQTAAPEPGADANVNTATEPSLAAAPPAADSVLIVPPATEQSVDVAHDTGPTSDIAPLNRAAEPTPAGPPVVPANVAPWDTPAERPHPTKAHARHKAPAAARETQWRDNFRTSAAWSWEREQKQTARSRHAKITARTTVEPDAGTGGPFVSAPSR